jgi:hypothetical protein
MTVTLAKSAVPLPLVVLYTTRERARTMMRAAFPRRRARLLLTRTPDELEHAFRSALVDAAIIDLAGAQDDTWRAASLAREFPSMPFFGLTTLRPAEAPALAQCAALDFADVLVEAVDDPMHRDIVLRHAFSTRFAEALREPPASLALDTPLQRSAWQGIVRWGGRPVRTQSLADALGVTREHLSRTFAADGAPNLKRRGRGARFRQLVAPVQHGTADRGDETRVAGAASRRGPRRALHEGTRTESGVASVPQVSVATRGMGSRSANCRSR